MTSVHIDHSFLRIAFKTVFSLSLTRNVVHRHPEKVAPLLMPSNAQGPAEAEVKPVGIVPPPPSNLPDSMRTAADEEKEPAEREDTAGPTDA